MSTAVTENRPRQIDKAGEFKAALDATAFELPSHIPLERFRRVVLTAVQMTPELLECSRKSVFLACQNAAKDGLLPDGREAALVVRLDKKSPTGKSASYQPMIAGIRKRARNSGAIATWDAHIVRANDHFQFQLGDAPQINHSYDLQKPRGEIVGAYSVAILKDGTKSYEVMSIDEINEIRNKSDGWRAFKAGKIKSTPWSESPGEMARKTVARRHAKTLPTSADLDDLIRQDDELYDMAGASDKAIATADRPKSLAARLDALAAPAPSLNDEPEGPTIDNETGEILSDEDDTDSDDADGPETDERPPVSSAPSEAEPAANSSKAAEEDKASEGNQSAPLAIGKDGTILRDNEDGLLERAMKRVAKGAKAYGLWVGGLSKEDTALIRPLNGELLRLAALNDAPTAEAGAPEPGSEESVERARKRGEQMAAAGAGPKAMPGEYRADGFEREARAWEDGYRAHKAKAS